MSRSERLQGHGWYTRIETDVRGDHYASLRLSSSNDGQDASLFLDDPAYPFTLTLQMSARGVRSAEVEARPGSSLSMKELRALPVKLIAELAGVTGEVLAAVAARTAAGSVPEPDLMTPTDLDAMEALRAVLGRLREAQPRPTQGRTELRRKVVAEYLEAVAAGHRAPRRVVAQRLGYSEQYVAQLLVEARRPEVGELPPTRRGQKNRPTEGER